MNTKHSTANGRRQQWGQGMTEFALALPIFLILVVGVIEIGHLLYLYSSVYAGAREAARYGASVSEDPGINRFADCAGIRNQARRIAFLSGLEDDQIVITFDNPDYESLVDKDCSEIAAEPSLVGLEQNKYNRVIVTITADYQPLIPIINFPEIPIQTSVGRTIIRNLYFRNYANQEIVVPEESPEPPAGTCPEIPTRTILNGPKTVEYLIDNPTDDSMIIESLSVYWLKNHSSQSLVSLSFFPAGGSGAELIWSGPDTTQETTIAGGTEGYVWRLVDSGLPPTDPANTGIRTIQPQTVGNKLIAQFGHNADLYPGITLEITFNHSCIADDETAVEN